jgi:hypothetical protein
MPVPDSDPVLTVIAFALFDSDEESHEALQLLETCPARNHALVAETFVESSLNAMYDVIDAAAPQVEAFAGDSMWTDAGADEVVPAFMDMVRSMPTRFSLVLWWPWVPQPLPNASLSITGDIYISLFANWRGTPSPEALARYESWPVALMRKYDHLSKGIQLADENLLSRPEARYMTDENAKRLEELRSKWDSEGRFHTFLFGDRE